MLGDATATYLPHGIERNVEEQEEALASSPRCYPTVPGSAR